MNKLEAIHLLNGITEDYFQTVSWSITSPLFSSNEDSFWDDTLTDYVFEKMGDTVNKFDSKRELIDYTNNLIEELRKDEKFKSLVRDAIINNDIIDVEELELTLDLELEEDTYNHEDENDVEGDFDRGEAFDWYTVFDTQELNIILNSVTTEIEIEDND